MITSEDAFEEVRFRRADVGAGVVRSTNSMEGKKGGGERVVEVVDDIEGQRVKSRGSKLEEKVCERLVDVELRVVEDVRLWGLGLDLVRSSRRDMSLGRGCIGVLEVMSTRSYLLRCPCRTLFGRVLVFHCN